MLVDRCEYAKYKYMFCPRLGLEPPSRRCDVTLKITVGASAQCKVEDRLKDNWQDQPG